MAVKKKMKIDLNDLKIFENLKSEKMIIVSSKIPKKQFKFIRQNKISTGKVLRFVLNHIMENEKLEEVDGS